MSETANPLMYWHTKGKSDPGRWEDPEKSVAMTEDGKWACDREDITGDTVLTVLEERDWGRPSHVHLDGKRVRVASLPIAREAFSQEHCIASELGVTRELPPCKKPVRTWVNGWSAGPCPVCSYHAGYITRTMGETGLWWRPVRLTVSQLDQLIASNTIRHSCDCVRLVPWAEAL